MSDEAFSITDLRERPEFAAVVAERVWDAWWKPKGHELAPIEAFVQTCLGHEPIPTALVAHDSEAYMGSALVIASDLDARPQYTPWVAAVWVDPDHRGKGIGSALVRAGAERVIKSGLEAVHLCAMPHNHRFYLRRGWTLIEADAAEGGLAVFQLQSASLI